MPSARLALGLLLLAGPALGGDAGRGRALVADRAKSLCLLCHAGPFPERRFQGDIAPPLDGAGARFTAAELRARLEDPGEGSIMPAYGAARGARVAPAFAGRPLLTEAEIEDIVAFLSTLRD